MIRRQIVCLTKIVVVVVVVTVVWSGDTLSARSQMSKKWVWVLVFSVSTVSCILYIWVTYCKNKNSHTVGFYRTKFIRFQGMFFVSYVQLWVWHWTDNDGYFVISLLNLREGAKNNLRGGFPFSRGLCPRMSPFPPFSAAHGYTPPILDDHLVSHPIPDELLPSPPPLPKIYFFK